MTTQTPQVEYREKLAKLNGRRDDLKSIRETNPEAAPMVAEGLMLRQEYEELRREVTERRIDLAGENNEGLGELVKEIRADSSLGQFAVILGF